MKALVAIAFRYFFFKKSTQIVNIISWISVLSIAVCSASLIIISSVFNGIDNLIVTMYNNYAADIKISPKQGKTLTLDSMLLNLLQDKKHIASYSKTLTIDAMIQYNHTQFLCKLQGIDSNFMNQQFEKKFIKKGQHFYPNYSNQSAILLSDVFESNLNLDIDRGQEELNIYTLPVKIKSIYLEQEMHNNSFFHIGTFQIHKDIDMNVCFVPIKTIQHLSGSGPNEFSTIEIYLNKNQLENIKKIKQQIVMLSNSKSLIIENSAEQNKNLFGILSSEKLMIFVIMGFIIFIATFNISSTISLLMMEKQSQVFLLKTFGYSNKHINWIFVLCGMLYGLFGLFIGVIVGTIIAWCQAVFHLVPIQGNFIINYFPVKIIAIDYLYIFIIVISITVLAIIFSIHKLKKNLNKNKTLHSL